MVFPEPCGPAPGVWRAIVVMSYLGKKTYTKTERLLLDNAQKIKILIC
jgi:hypothetical protein